MGSELSCGRSSQSHRSGLRGSGKGEGLVLMERECRHGGQEPTCTRGPGKGGGQGSKGQRWPALQQRTPGASPSQVRTSQPRHPSLQAREVPCSTLKGETVPDSLPATPNDLRELLRVSLRSQGHCGFGRGLSLCDPKSPPTRWSHSRGTPKFPAPHHLSSFSPPDRDRCREVHSSIRGARESRGLLSSHFRANETSSMLVSRT